MLRRIAPNLFQGTTGETVIIAAIAHGNGGVEAATFRYGARQVPTRQVQGHPGCGFNVRAGAEIFGALVVFEPSSPNARYELFQEDDSGILQPLQVIARPLSGPIVQFQIVAAAADTVAVTPRVTKKAAKKTTKRAVSKTAKKTAKKVAKRVGKNVAKKVVKKAAKKAEKKSVKTTSKRTRKAAKRRPR
jgi:hypothetical protein